MSHRLGMVATPAVCLGLRLTGLRPLAADSPEAAARLLDEMLGDARWGVVLVQEDLMPGAVPSAWHRSGTGLPIVVPFPAPRRERPIGEAEAYVAELLRQAVGYRVRLR
jgi:vacuolar-type H+-ATPase subunit F/Vma7